MQAKHLETRVGFFLLAGLAIIAALIVMFGRVGESWRNSYAIAVTFENASGLLKGSSVLYAGAPVGRVMHPPVVIDEGRAVEVWLTIHEEVKIRQNAKFVIGSSGLLGDRFVDVQARALVPGEAEPPFLQAGDRIQGYRTPGLADLTEGSKPLLDKANVIAGQLQEFISRLNRDILTDATAEDLRQSIKHLRSILGRVDGLLTKVDSTKSGFGRLLNDPKLSADLAAFVSNLREHGVLFYSDSADKDKEKSQKRR